MAPRGPLCPAPARLWYQAAGAAAVLPGAVEGEPGCPRTRLQYRHPEVRELLPSSQPGVPSTGARCPVGRPVATGGGRAFQTTGSRRGPTGSRPHASAVLRRVGRASGRLAILAVRKRSVTPPLRPFGPLLVVPATRPAGFLCGCESWPPQGC